MRDNLNNEIRLVIGDVEISGWDNVTADSQIDTPADNWSLSLFREDGQPLPESVHGAAKIQLFYNNEVILTSIADNVDEAVSRQGYGLEISGRDLAGQLIDCSVPIFNGRQITLEEMLQRFVKAGDLAGVIRGVNIQNNRPELRNILDSVYKLDDNMPELEVLLDEAINGTISISQLLEKGNEIMPIASDTIDSTYFLPKAYLPVVILKSVLDVN